MKHVFIINPTAGKGDNRRRVYAMAEQLRREHGADVTCMLTESSRHATEYCRTLAQSGEEIRFYACGGDGTIHSVVNGIAGFEAAAMTCIPVGTGNDFLKNFGEDTFPKFFDVQALYDAPVQPLDLIDCNGKLCLTIACTGIDARIAESVHSIGSSPLLTSRGSYLASIAVNFLFRGIAQHWTVTLDGEEIEDDFSLVSLCNGRYYGSGVMPVPEARMDDGVLHAVLIRKVSRAKFARLFPLYSKGEYANIDPAILRVTEAKELRIRSDDEFTTGLDGECFRSHDVFLRLSEKKINFFGPAGCNPNATARGGIQLVKSAF